MEKWLHTDEYGEIVATLRSCREFLKLTSTDVAYWKWVFIALHNAVQGCMVVALTGSDGLGALNAKQEKKWREAYASGGNPPGEKEHLLSFRELYEKIKRNGVIQSSDVDCFRPSETQDYSIKKLCEIRDEFIHFTPKGWALELSGGPTMAIDCLDVAAFLVNSSGRFFIFSDYKEGEIIGLIRGLQADLKAVKFDS